jgi:hypothetical protein
LKNDVSKMLEKEYRFDSEKSQDKAKINDYGLSMITGIDSKIKYLTFVLILGVAFSAIIWGLKHLTKSQENAKKLKKQK